MKAIKGFVKKETVPVERAKLAPLERTIDNCTVISIPAGAAPKNVIVELPGSDGARVTARYTGFPAIAVDDSVSVRKAPGSGAQYAIIGTSGGTPGGVLNNFSATAAPTTSDDANDGYAVGSLWVDVTNDNAYICQDATATAAVWAQIDGAGGGWPGAGLAMINNTEYDTVQAAIDAMSAGDIIKVGQGTDSGGITADTAGALVGLSPTETIITRSTDGAITATVSAADVSFDNLTIASTGAGVFPRCLYTNQARTRIRNCTIQKTSGAPNLAVGVLVDSGGTCTIEAGTQITVTSGTTKQALYVDGTGSVVVEAGVVLNGTSADIYLDNSTAIVELRGCQLLGGGISNAAGGTVKGWYYDAYGRVVRIKPVGTNNVRLTLTSGTPVTSSNVTAATTIYAALYKGNTIEVYNGSGWAEAPFTELSLSLSGFTADKNSDVFVYDNAGTLALERVEWTNDTTRATALTTQDGRYVKNGDTTRLYLGTFRTTGTTGQCEDSATHRYVWNYYNRELRSLLRTYSASHTYNTATWRAFNNSATNAQVDFVAGVLEDAISINCGEEILFTAGDGNANAGCGVNTTSGSTLAAVVMAIPGQLYVWTHGVVFGQAGYNYVCPLEFTSGGGNAPTYRESTVTVLLKG